MESFVRTKLQAPYPSRPERRPPTADTFPPDERRRDAAPSESGWLERILIRENGRLVVVKLAEVDWIEGAGNYVRIHAGARTHLLRQTLQLLERRLDPARFTRIHRSTIVNLDRIAELRPTISGSYDVTLSSGERLSMSRAHRRRALELVGTI